MRAGTLACLLLLAALLAPSGLAQDARFQPDWQRGPAEIAYQGHVVHVPAHVSYASDGETYLYGSTDTPDALASSPGECVPPDDTTPWVLVSTDPCSAGRHPGVACSGTDICLLGRAAPGGYRPREIGRDGWTQFLPDWLEGPANFTWQGRNASVAAGVRYATDGETWLYGSTATREELERPPGCGPGDSATYVMLTANCVLARHPGIACAGTDLCDAGIGQTRPFGPPPTVAATDGTAVGTTPTYPLDSCGRIQYARCTPAVSPILGALSIAAIAFTARASRGRA